MVTEDCFSPLDLVTSNDLVIYNELQKNYECGPFQYYFSEESD